MELCCIAVIGAGKVATVLSSLLAAKGYRITEVMSRTSSSAERLAAKLGARVVYDPADLTAKIILIAVSDRAIRTVANRLAIPSLRGRILLHTSGASDASILAAAREAGLHIGSIHPLFSFARVDHTAEELGGISYAIDGDRSACDAATEIAHALGGKPFTVPAEMRALYHAGAVCASNYLVTLLLTAAHWLTLCGLCEKDALQALLPLAQGTLENLACIGNHALTGPIARNDTITVDNHLHILGAKADDQLDFYRQLGIMTADIAYQNGRLSADARAELHQLLRRDIHEQTC